MAWNFNGIFCNFWVILVKLFVGFSWKYVFLPKQYFFKNSLGIFDDFFLYLLFFLKRPKTIFVLRKNKLRKKG